MTYFLSFHLGGMIVSPLWYDRPTQVKRSNHPGETVKISYKSDLALSFNGFS